MKTYLLDTINRIKRYSEKLDVETSLCNTPWVVFSDSGDKEVFIFEPDGTVLITVNGVGIKRTWQWIPANKSLIINQPDDTIVMLHPEYFNNSVLALNRDGTQEYAFLIDENNRDSFAPKTLTQLRNYFQYIEQRAIEAAEKERRERKEEEQRIEEEKHHKEMLSQVDNKFKVISQGCFLWAIITFILSLTSTYIIFLHVENVNVTIVSFFLSLLIIVLIGFMFIDYVFPRIKAKKFIKENPSDELVPYIKEAFDLK